VQRVDDGGYGWSTMAAAWRRLRRLRVDDHSLQPDLSSRGSSAGAMAAIVLFSSQLFFPFLTYLGLSSQQMRARVGGSYRWWRDKEASKDDEGGAASPARPVDSAPADSSMSKAPFSSQCIFPLSSLSLSLSIHGLGHAWAGGGLVWHGLTPGNLLSLI
jgi:hypothetical protein